VSITSPSSGFSILLDPNRKVANLKNTLVGISHAHSDHVRNHSSKILSTAPTNDLINFSLDIHTLEYNQSFDFDGMEVIPRNANHVLGSCQFELRGNEKTVVYTGDFRLDEGGFFDTCYIPECDALIIESTYGLPHFKFPSFEQISREVENWTDGNLRERNNILFGAYALGKSQEIIKILNKMDLVPVVHPKISKVSEIYRKNKVKLDYVDSGSEEGEEMMKDQFVGVMPTHMMNDVLFSDIRKRTGRDVKTSVLTGWGMLFKYSGIDRVFPLSDHCDFYQLLDYIEMTGAKRVYTVHGYERQFAAEVRRRLKIFSRPLHSEQLKIGDF